MRRSACCSSEVASSENAGSLVRHGKDHYRIRLFDSSRLHYLDSSASSFRTEHDFYIDVFFKNRWYSGNHKRDVASLIQALNAFSTTLERLNAIPGLTS